MSHLTRGDLWSLERTQNNATTFVLRYWHTRKSSASAGDNARIYFEDALTIATKFRKFRIEKCSMSLALRMKPRITHTLTEPTESDVHDRVW